MSKIEGIVQAKECDLYSLRKHMLVDGDVDRELMEGEEYNRLAEEELEIPQGVTFGGALILNDSKLKRVGANVTVLGSCSFFGSDVEEIGDWFSVEGNLSLRFSQAKRLPNNLYVGGDLYICDSDIEVLSSGLHVKGDVYADGIDLIVEGEVIVEGKIIR